MSYAPQKRGNSYLSRGYTIVVLGSLTPHRSFLGESYPAPISPYTDESTFVCMLNRSLDVALPPIQRPYLLLMPIPYFEDDDGNVWLERLWHRDFVRHLQYLKHLTMVALRLHISEAREIDLVKVEIPSDCTLRFRPLPPQGTRLTMFRNMPRTARTLWSAIGEADIVHGGVIGWPYPLGWLACPFALLRKKKLLLVIESADWRLAGTGRNSLAKRAEEQLYELAAKQLVNHADLTIFTQPSYRDSLMSRPKGTGHVIPASWISEEDVIANSLAEDAWRKKREHKRVRLLFAARLAPEKGVETLLSALALLRDRKLPIDVDIIGGGDLRARCVQAAANLYDEDGLRVRMLDTVRYEDFLPLVRSYHALLIPSLSDEQPRIVFDSYAQAVPVLASDTDGIRPHVFPHQTGWLVAPGDAKAWADAITKASANDDLLETFGKNALAYGSTITHASTHRERWRLIQDQLLA
jgi:glycosyltransferase involved in cell wall biosynthesis